jgi:6-phosphogluconolactonase
LPGAGGRTSVESDPESLARAAARAIADGIVEACARRGSCALALAGGSTPRRAYERLAAIDLPWRDVQVYFGDERCVPPGHRDSNHAMAKAALLDRVAIPPAHVHRMRGELDDADAAAREYERELPAALDLLLLGIGPDAHTASLFPGSDALREARRRVVAVVADKPPPRRITITPPVIASAREVLVLAAGADKAEAVRRALRGDEEPSRCPARLLRDARWLLDAAAAGGIGAAAPASERPREMR